MGYVTLNWQRISPTFIALLMTTCHLVAITVFLKGYLLTRFELGNVSQCRDPDLSWYESHIKDENNRSSCWSEPAFDRTVVFLVDALRFDFVFEGDLPPGMPELLRMLHEAVSSLVAHTLVAGRFLDGPPRNGTPLAAPQGPDAAAAFKFIADTPSVTSSRLKAMLTVGYRYTLAVLLTWHVRHGTRRREQSVEGACHVSTPRLANCVQRPTRVTLCRETYRPSWTLAKASQPPPWQRTTS